MSEHRWSKFWWQDWQRDPALRMCSPAARGVWMDMLAIMFDATPHGHLLVNGRAPTNRQLGSVFGVAEKVASVLISELEEAGVFSRSEEGVIISRRMVRDHAASEAGREAIAKRWAKPRQTISDPITPPISPPGSLEAEADTDTDKEERTELRSGAEAPIDARKVVWSEGLQRLIAITGLPPGKARSRLGQLLRDAGDQCVPLLAVLRDCPETKDPNAWLTKAASGIGGRGASVTQQIREEWDLPAIPDDRSPSQSVLRIVG
jgi:hypothetical protein